MLRAVETKWLKPVNKKTVLSKEDMKLCRIARQYV